MHCIAKYFNGLSDRQMEQFEMLDGLYRDWNAKINVISRKDIDNLYLHHVLHSLAIAKIVPFNDGSKIVDIGTGGGFPGIPLAIMFPNCRFDLVESVGKKLKVVADVAEKLGLDNISIIHGRMEEVKGTYDFAVSRAAMDLPKLVGVCKKNIGKEQKNCLPNGLVCLKGGDLQEETRPFKGIVTVYDLTEFFNEEYFKTKKAVYLPLC